MNIFSPEIVRKFDDLSQARIDYVSQIKAPAHIHVMGACGTGTGSIVCLLKQLGFFVSGSDKAFYPPMGEFIRKYADKLYESFSPENLNKKPDLVVIGNALSRGNVELEKALELNIPFCSMPELLSALLILDRSQNPTSVVVSGTHGKTTTTALIAHCLSVLNRGPGYFFGGVPTGDILDLPIKPVDLNQEISKRISVIEGDEYDSAFFAKYSKFQCYRPEVLVITNIEFDHGDIFPSIEDIYNEFREVLIKLPSNGVVVACRDHNGAKEFLEKSNFKNIIWYGESEGSQVRLISKEAKVNQDGSFLQKLKYDVHGEELDIETGLSGAHNALNIGATIAVLSHAGESLATFKEAISSFSHVKRRQQVLINSPKLTLIEDFAHHPTEVFYTLSGIKEAFSGRRIFAVFEPRSNTSRRAFFKDEYVRSLAVADVVCIKEVDNKTVGYAGVSGDKALLDVSILSKELQEKNVKALSKLSVDEVFLAVTTEFNSGDVLVVMSNGDFGGIIKKFQDWGSKLTL